MDENVAARGGRKLSTPTTAQIINKLKRLIWARLEAMEKEADGTEAMRLLDGAMRSVTKLAEHEKRHKAASKRPVRSSKEMQLLRQQIADRIEQLNQG